jgi:hypothetical protein
MPRLWMVPPTQLCLQHLLGEHHECHMFLGALKLRRRLGGYIAGNYFALADLHARHEELAVELVRRNRKHSSPFPVAETVAELGAYLPPHPRVNRELAAADLFRRCPDCKQRQEHHQ